MMTGQQLKNSILQLAIQGKLVPQDPADEPASVLLEQIRKQKLQLVKEGKLKKKDLDTTPISDDDKPFEIPESWEWVRLKSGLCLSFSTGPFGTMLHKDDYVEKDGIPLVNPANIIDGKICLKNIKYVGVEKAQSLQQYVLHEGDIVLARRGDLSKCSVVGKNENGYLAGTGAFFMSLTGIDLKFFCYLYKSPYCQSYLLSESIGDTMDNLNQKLLGSLIIPLPPLAEQRRIVAKIEELMPLVEKYDASQKELEILNNDLPAALKKSILQQAIQGKLVPQDPADEPASVLLEQIRKQKLQLVKEGKLKKKDLDTTPITDDDKPFDIPDSWDICRLKELCCFKNPDKRKGKQLLLDAKYLRGKSNGETVDNGNYVDKGASIILVDGENSGEVFVTPHQGYMGSTFKELWLTQEMDIDYTHLFFILIKETLRKNKRGAAIPHLDKELFFDFIIPLPPLAEQHRIVAKIEELFALIDKK